MVINTIPYLGINSTVLWPPGVCEVNLKYANHHQSVWVISNHVWKSNTNIWLIQTCHVFLIASRSNTTKKDQIQDFAPGGSIFNWSQAPEAPATPGAWSQLQDFVVLKELGMRSAPRGHQNPTIPQMPQRSDRSDWMIKLSTNLQWTSAFFAKKNVGEQVGYEELQSQQPGFFY